MAKVLQFMNGSTLYEAEPVKIERKKIYEYKEISALESAETDDGHKFIWKNNQ